MRKVCHLFYNSKLDIIVLGCSRQNYGARHVAHPVAVVNLAVSARTLGNLVIAIAEEAIVPIERPTEDSMKRMDSSIARMCGYSSLSAMEKDAVFLLITVGDAVTIDVWQLTYPIKRRRGWSRTGIEASTSLEPEQIGGELKRVCLHHEEIIAPAQE